MEMESTRVDEQSATNIGAKECFNFETLFHKHFLLRDGIDLHFGSSGLRVGRVAGNYLRRQLS